MDSSRQALQNKEIFSNFEFVFELTMYIFLNNSGVGY